MEPESIGIGIVIGIIITILVVAIEPSIIGFAIKEPCPNYECRSALRPALFEKIGTEYQCGEKKLILSDDKYEYSIKNIDKTGASYTLFVDCKSVKNSEKFSQIKYIAPGITEQFVIDPNKLGKEWCCTLDRIDSDKVEGCNLVLV